MKARLASATALGLMATLLGSPAFAGPFELTAGIGGITTGDLTGYVQFTGTPPVPSEHVFVGPLEMTVTDTAIPSSIQQTLYCTDIFHDFVSGGLYNRSSSSLSGRIGSPKTDQINALLSNAPQNDANAGAAVQAAIWEIENEPGTTGYNVSTGELTVAIDGSPAGFASDVATDLLNVTNGTWLPQAGVSVWEYVPINGANQSFGYLALSGGGGDIPVPEPATLGILGLGMLGVAATRRKRQTQLT